jgi:hypothetical protein
VKAQGARLKAQVKAQESFNEESIRNYSIWEGFVHLYTKTTS